MLLPPTLHEPPPPPPLITEEVRSRALGKLLALLKGNGIKAEKVSIESVTAQTLTFEAKAYVRLATRYASKSLPGKIDKGEAIGSPQAFEAALRNMTVEMQRDAGKRQTIIDFILARPDKGYGARDQVVKFEALSKDYVSHEACANCSNSGLGVGKMICTKCGGNTSMTCQNCHGRQNILCPHCRGNGTVTQNGKVLTCTRCKGRTRVQCPACQGRGQVKCKGCNGSGAASCATCKASGFISHLAHVELMGHLHFDYDRQGLPIELTKLIDAFSTRYIEKGDIDLGIEMPSYDENEPPENIPILYHVTVPYGEITFKIGKKIATCVMLGHNGELIKGPEFLDAITHNGQQLLARAASGQGNVGGNLRAAAKYRILREAIIIAAGQMPVRKALSKLLQKYPVGISSEKVLKFLMQANQAMQVITYKPRLIGLSVGSIAFSVIAALYFMVLRTTLLPELVNIPVDPNLSLMLCDVVTCLVGTLVIVMASQAFAGNALKKSLTGLASSAAMKNILPKIGWTLWAAFALSLAVTAAFYFMFALQ